jgi:8-oxo-dGTP pyrophosphatase MutT (NUDIX family)
VTEVRFEHARRLDCRFDPRPWDWAEKNQALIASHWAAVTARQPALFDGEVLVLHRGSIEDGVFRGAYRKARYAAFLTARDHGFPDGTRNGFAMGALRSRDGAFLLGVMGRHTANPGKIYFPAGTPDLSDVVGDSVDLAGSVARELEEETGLAAPDVAFADDWTVVFKGPRVAYMRRVTIDMDAREAKALMESNIAAQEDPELAGIHVVRGERDVDEQRMPDFMCAYLRREFSLARSDQPAG